MRDFIKNKLVTIILIIATVILAGIAIFTAIRLYQLRGQPVAPSAPTSKPKAAATPQACTPVTFNLGTATATATATGTATATATSSPREPNACGGTCSSNSNCKAGLFCYQGFCRNPQCQTDTDCVCDATATATTTAKATAAGTKAPTGTSKPAATASAPPIPDSGTSLPTVVGIGVGIILLISAFILAI